MAEDEKDTGFMGIIKDTLSNITRVAVSSIFPPLVDGTEAVMKKVEERLLIMEKKILRKIYALMLIGFGGIFLLFALMFFLTDSLGWTKAEAFFAIGIIIFVIGLLLKIGESDR